MTEDADLPDPLTPAEAAAQMRLSVITVWGWCERGKLPALKVGRSWRIRRADWIAFKQRNHQPAKTARRKPAGRPPGPSRVKALDRLIQTIGTRGGPE